MRRVALTSLVMLTLFEIAMSGCVASSSRSVASLQLSEHQLARAPELEPFAFQPLEASQEEVLSEHASDRAMRILTPTTRVQGNLVISSLGDGRGLVAVLMPASEGQPEQTVRLLSGNDTVFEAAAGLPSPERSLRALWTYDGHWALEVLLIDRSTRSGEVYIDGELISARKAYDEAFGLQLLADKPFFFYRRNSRVGYSYNGHETELNYDEVPHYRCCLESSINPVQARNMVAFFAVREQTWFYVELGVFDT